MSIELIQCEARRSKSFLHLPIQVCQQFIGSVPPPKFCWTPSDKSRCLMPVVRDAHSFRISKHARGCLLDGAPPRKAKRSCDSSRSLQEPFRSVMRRMRTHCPSVHPWHTSSMLSGYDGILTFHLPIRLDFDEGSTAVDRAMEVYARCHGEVQRRCNVGAREADVVCQGRLEESMLEVIR